MARLIFCDFSGAKGGAFDRALSGLVNFSASAENVQPVLKTIVTKTRAVMVAGEGEGRAGEGRRQSCSRRDICSPRSAGHPFWRTGEASSLLGQDCRVALPTSAGTHHPHVQPRLPLPGQHHAFPGPQSQRSAWPRGPEQRAHCCALRPGSAGRETYMSPRLRA